VPRGGRRPDDRGAETAPVMAVDGGYQKRGRWRWPIKEGAQPIWLLSMERELGSGVRRAIAALGVRRRRSGG
jgi:hypothetical protein